MRGPGRGSERDLNILCTVVEGGKPAPTRRPTEIGTRTYCPAAGHRASPGPRSEGEQHPRVLPPPKRANLVLAQLPCSSGQGGTTQQEGRDGDNGVVSCPPPALQPALPPAAWGGWRGRGMAAICRARLNNRPPRKISRPPPRPSIVFGTRCCFFQLLSYFSLTFFPDLRHMPSPCPAALN